MEICFLHYNAHIRNAFWPYIMTSSRSAKQQEYNSRSTTAGVQQQEYNSKSTTASATTRALSGLQMACETTQCMMTVLYLIWVATIGRWLTQLSDQTGTVQQHLVQDFLTEWRHLTDAAPR